MSAEAKSSADPETLKDLMEGRDFEGMWDRMMHDDRITEDSLHQLQRKSKAMLECFEAGNLRYDMTDRFYMMRSHLPFLQNGSQT